MKTLFLTILFGMTLGACAATPGGDRSGLLSYDALGAEIVITVTPEPLAGAGEPDEVVASARH